MRLSILLLLSLCLAGPDVNACPQAPKTTKADKNDQPAGQQGADANKQPKFKTIAMGEGFTKSRSHFSSTGYIEESSGISVVRTSVYYQLADSAKQEFTEEIADEIESGGQLKPEKNESPNEKRALIVMPSKKGCAEPTKILFTAGATFRSIYSCSSEVAHEFERLQRDFDTTAVQAAKSH
jgi:hypothetical protein